MQGLNGVFFAMLSFPCCYLNAIYYMALYFALNSCYLSLFLPLPASFHSVVLTISLTFFFHAFFYLLFKCKLQLHTICIENRKFTQQTVSVYVRLSVSEGVSELLYLFLFCLLLSNLKSENSLYEFNVNLERIYTIVAFSLSFKNAHTFILSRVFFFLLLVLSMVLLACSHSLIWLSCVSFLFIHFILYR